ncbi:MAG: endo-1,4-beta-xylanase [Defluviitaleaceae bacterium]|nr:endo-1,4-beta-xylanase [Defluviitaleaceae bacterium]
MKDSLYRAFEKNFMFGNILSPEDLQNENLIKIYKKHYNAVTAENVMKPVNISKSENNYFFENADKIINFGTENNIKVIGHTLCWHGQSAIWLNRNEDGTVKTREEAKTNLEKFIKEYVTRYSGKIYSWDVLNEAFRDEYEFSGNWKEHLRRDEDKEQNTSHWYLAYKNNTKNEDPSDYIFDAFYFARKYDKKGLLYYNDYNEEIPGKREAIGAMVEYINDKWKNHKEYDNRLLIEGIGMQSHYNENTNFDNVIASFERFIKTGTKIAITELDLTFGSKIEPAKKSEEIYKKQAEIYKHIFRIYLKYARNIERVTMWAKTDNQSWRAWGLPVLFDENLEPKPAFFEILSLV